MEEDNEFKADTTWFHILKDMVDSGDMAALGSAFMVYIAIKSHVNFATGLAFPSIELLMKKCKLSKSQVQRCLNKLEEYEYISREKAVDKKGIHNVYRLREKVKIKDVDGVPQAIATWDYIPNGVKDAVAELKNVVATGKMIDGKIIHIEHLILNLTVFNDSTQNVHNYYDTNKEKIKENIKTLKDIIEKKPH